MYIPTKPIWNMDTQIFKTRYVVKDCPFRWLVKIESSQLCHSIQMRHLTLLSVLQTIQLWLTHVSNKIRSSLETNRLCCVGNSAVKQSIIRKETNRWCLQKYLINSDHQTLKTGIAHSFISCKVWFRMHHKSHSLSLPSQQADPWPDWPRLGRWCEWRV